MAIEISDRNADAPIHQIGDARANGCEVCSIRVPLDDGIRGTLVASLRRSEDIEDRGFVVLSITIEDEGKWFVPTATNIKNGIELHIGADHETKFVLSAIAALRAANVLPPNL